CFRRPGSPSPSRSTRGGRYARSPSPRTRRPGKPRSGSAWRAELHSDARVIRAHGDLAGGDAERLMPDLQRVLAGRRAGQLERSGLAGERIERVIRDHHPGAHPRMEIAVDANDLRFGKRDGNRPPARLRTVEDRVVLARAVQVVEQAVAVEKLHRSS